VVEDRVFVGGAEFVVGDVDITVVFLDPLGFSFGFTVFFIAFDPFEDSSWFTEIGHFIELFRIYFFRINICVL